MKEFVTSLDSFDYSKGNRTIIIRRRATPK